VVWVGAGVAAAAWVVLLAVLTAAGEPRDVEAGAPTLDLPGDEPAAVVALVTGDWELDRDAVTATVLDLAARRHITIEWIAPHTFVRVRGATTADADALTAYEQQVLTHLRGLAAETRDGMVPAEALTTGPRAEARGWWKRFERAVTDDARARGLSRPRWGAGARTVLGAGAVVVGLAVGGAATTLPHQDPDQDPVGTAIALGVVTAAALCTVAGRLRGERDTPAGRTAAARWLGLREMLADDPTFPVQPPAAVAIWGRLMAHGAAMGVAGAAADTLRLGTEHERLAWSPVGDRWRPVRIRYPDVVPPGYGRPPLLVAAVGLACAALGVLVGPGAVAVGRSVLDGVASFASVATVPWWVRLAVGVVVGIVVAAAAIAAAAGLSMLVTGSADLVRPRRTVEGRVLRIRERGDGDDRRYWHMAVDDGTADRVRAWRLGQAPEAHQGDTVRASVSRWLGHVKDLTVVERRDGGPTAPPAGVEAAPAAAGPLPALPDAAAVAAALGRPVTAATDATAHPLAVDGASATYVTADGGRVLAAWVPPSSIDALRALPRAVAPAVTGIGGEAFRAPFGGGVLARFGPHVLLVTAALPAADAATRDAAVTAVASLIGTG